MQVMCEIFLKSLYIFRFDKEEEVKFQFKKILVTCSATGSWQILLLV